MGNSGEVSSSDDPTIFQPNDTVSERYRVERLIGRGGMGEVYEVRDLEDGRRLALKTVLPELLGSTKVVQRFERETEISRLISHPNVLPIYDVFKVPVPKAIQRLAGRNAAETVPCMVMEYLDGETVADRLMAGRKFSEEETREVICQVASALAAAHDHSIVHRDLKPDNIFLVPGDGGEDGGTRVVLTDFGVARQAVQEGEEALTASNVILGTPEYMAPEQLELEDAMPASDLYTLGLVMFEMLTLERPFKAETPLKMVFRRVEEDPPSPRQYRPNLSSRWEEAILTCLARNPDERYADAYGLIEAIDGSDSPWLESRHGGLGGGKLDYGLWLSVAGILLALAVVAFLLLS